MLILPLNGRVIDPPRLSLATRPRGRKGVTPAE
jgi:hypothetical protein